MFTTYIIHSKSLNRYYIGHTSDIDQRLDSHNKGSNKFTKKGIPWKLVYTKNFSDKTDAIKFELYIKKMKSKLYIEKLISVG